MYGSGHGQEPLNPGLSQAACRCSDLLISDGLNQHCDTQLSLVPKAMNPAAPPRAAPGRLGPGSAPGGSLGSERPRRPCRWARAAAAARPGTVALRHVRAARYRERGPGPHLASCTNHFLPTLDLITVWPRASETSQRCIRAAKAGAGDRRRGEEGRRRRVKSGDGTGREEALR
eukprot:768471-Hanusia_phi.AAC.5